MKFNPLDHVTLTGLAGILAMVSIPAANEVVSLFMGLATLVYVVARTVLMIEHRNDKKPPPPPE